jgi:hypothetical protein
MEKINNPSAAPESASFEQTGNGITFTLPGGEAIAVQGRFKGPDLSIYDGVNADGQQVYVEFTKNDDDSLAVLEIKIDGKTIYYEEPEELQEAA